MRNERASLERTHEHAYAHTCTIAYKQVLADGCEVLHQKHNCLNACMRIDDTRFKDPAFREAMAKMLDMGALANIRPQHIPLAANQHVEEALDLTRWNDADWGLARHTIPETRLWSSCEAPCTDVDARHVDEL